MDVHTVQKGESLSVIARQHGIRFWANMYLAAENDGFRDKRPNPDLIQPGDRIVIPSKASIARLEARAEVNHTLPKLFTQPTLDLCWQACAKMLYCWKNRGGNAEADFKNSLGTDYDKPGGLQMQNRIPVLSKLGMRSANVTNINQLHELLCVKGPLWVAEINGGAHAQILTGYNLMNCTWSLLDPLGKGMTITFDEAGGATGGSMGAANLGNMTRRRSINSMVLDNLVFGYI
jgi:hypothetical protein